CFFFQAEDGIRDWSVTGVQTCALPIYPRAGGVQGGDRDDPRAGGGQRRRDRGGAQGQRRRPGGGQEGRDRGRGGREEGRDRGPRSEERRVGKEGRWR